MKWVGTGETSDDLEAHSEHFAAEASVVVDFVASLAIHNRASAVEDASLALAASYGRALEVPTRNLIAADDV